MNGGRWKESLSTDFAKSSRSAGLRAAGTASTAARCSGVRLSSSVSCSSHCACAVSLATTPSLRTSTDVVCVERVLMEGEPSVKMAKRHVGWSADIVLCLLRVTPNRVGLPQDTGTLVSVDASLKAKSHSI